MGSTTKKEERVVEVGKLLDLIEEHMAELSSVELSFVESMGSRLDDFGEKTDVSDKQLFWLRDIKDKY